MFSFNFTPNWLIFAIIGIFLSCHQPAHKETASRPLSLHQQFVELKYDGQFKTDTLFDKKLQAELEQAKTNQNEQQIKDILKMQIEWNLLKGNGKDTEAQLTELSNYSFDETFLWLMAYQKVILQKLDTAIVILNKNAAEQPAIQVKKQWLLGSIYEEKKMDSMAIQHYNKAVEIGPVENEVDYYLESLFHSGNLKYTSGKIEKAAVIYQKALEESIQFKVNRLIPFGHYHLGKVAEKKGHKEKALTAYQEAIDLLRPSSYFLVSFIEKKIAALVPNEAEAISHHCFALTKGDTGFIQLPTEKEAGEKLIIYGKVIDADNGKPIEKADIFLYQADKEGNYNSSILDMPSYARIRGDFETGPSGCFKIQTIVPGNYPGYNTGKHIHVIAKAKGYEKWTFEFLFEGWITESLREEVQRKKDAIILDLQEKRDGAWVIEADIELNLK